MATTTPNFGWDVPTSTDYVKDGATAIETLGDDIDARFGDITNFPNQIVNVVSGVSRPVSFSMSAGAGTTNGSGVLTVTFPASRFTQAPLIVATVASTSGSLYATTLAHASVTTTGATIFSGNSTNAAARASVPLNWLALQMTSAASNG
jgi:hypothetical protein